MSTTSQSDTPSYSDIAKQNFAAGAADTKAAAQGIVDWGKGVVSNAPTSTEEAKKDAGGFMDKVENTASSATHSVGNFLSDNGPGIAGALLGVAGAWLAGTIFGGGTIGWIITLLMGVGMAMAGMNWGKESPVLNRWFGHTLPPTNDPVPQQGNAPQLVQSQGGPDQSAQQIYDAYRAQRPTMPQGVAYNPLYNNPPPYITEGGPGFTNARTYYSPRGRY